LYFGHVVDGQSGLLFDGVDRLLLLLGCFGGNDKPDIQGVVAGIVMGDFREGVDDVGYCFKTVGRRFNGRPASTRRPWRSALYSGPKRVSVP